MLDSNQFRLRFSGKAQQRLSSERHTRYAAIRRVSTDWLTSASTESNTDLKIRSAEGAAHGS